MVPLIDPLLIVALALNFVTLGVSRIRGVINAVALQGVLLGILPLFVHQDVGFRVILLVGVTIGLKGFVIPRFLVHALREATIQEEVKPLVNFMGSLLLGRSAPAWRWCSRTRSLLPNSTSTRYWCRPPSR